MKIILLGAPGCGKGTQSALIKEKYNLPHISTGDIFRENIKNETELGKLAKSYMDNGALVPDSLTCDLVKDRLSKEDCKNGFILDGFPRTIAQAEALDTFSDIDRAILIDVDFDVIVSRLSGRRTCPVCKNIYNTSSYNNDTCECGTKLIQRDDDKEETIRKRLSTYESQTYPLIEYYKKCNKLSVVKGKDKPEETFEDVKKVLETL